VPTYEYECTACGQHVEVFQRITEDALTTCGACDGPLRKVFHPAGIVFKGSGFYATDNRSKPKTSTSSSSGGSSKESGATGSGSEGSTGSGSGSDDGSSGGSGSSSSTGSSSATPPKERSA
jgi:putative FmdB family regulatory protein